MIVSRLINGVGTGVLSATVPVYGSEHSDYESRGQFIANGVYIEHIWCGSCLLDGIRLQLH